MSSFIDSNGNCINDAIVEIYHGNTKCNKVGSRGGAGGYISGIIKLSHRLIAYATIGGKGTVKFASGTKIMKGGYGGGGSASNYNPEQYSQDFGSGGGQTAVKFLANDLWHRVIVSGAGGGSDNGFTKDTMEDDGSGGSGGGVTAQGYWVNGILNSERLANSTFGFTFGYGESAQQFGSQSQYGVRQPVGDTDKPGAGSGWFGGFAGHNENGGAGGGSSWALSADAIIPPGNIPAKGSYYNESESHPYYFSLNDGYVFSDVKSIPGIWEGNGRLVITILDSIIYPSLTLSCMHISYSVLFIILIESNSN
ncbi:PE-PGRS protein, putative [Trichomonas vaginalis G3]|uniref:receptor protein-tyrosine kinase n=1 Tax=Trichomonas vaginalis (strain ATCC PRA-98 / G3) TaxID=412133 RepID=A2FFF9_TRIV3|nr:glycine-rich protein family [Trichomonas vaginalis G3]EAX96368.1 PE-PGRS protein, putative [Trichomonas vaginalis G3]KAI5548997.1 glycine-rich protein family [Trichomonas vaginalis G3]|eukprot:XP_001309298.1 PE-PGRS protein [Trichomonas vaginalis G3]